MPPRKRAPAPINKGPKASSAMEEDSDSDSDYDISKDKTAQEDEIQDVKEEHLEAMGAGRMRKATSAWDEMNALFSQESKAKMDGSVLALVSAGKAGDGGASAGASKDKKKSKDKGKVKAEKKKGSGKIKTKAASVLAGIFGKSVAASMLAPGGGSVSQRSKTTAKVTKQGVDDDEEHKARMKEIRARALAATKGLAKKEQVTEVRKFAGREIVVERTVAAGEKALMKMQPKETTGIGKVLEDIRGPKSVSTVTKSSLDWDNFKEEEGLNDELAKVSKDGQGILGKRDFLNRCDVRAFEQERDVRLANAAKNVAPGKK